LVVLEIWNDPFVTLIVGAAKSGWLHRLNASPRKLQSHVLQNLEVLGAQVPVVWCIPREVAENS